MYVCICKCINELCEYVVTNKDKYIQRKLYKLMYICMYVCMYADLNRQHHGADMEVDLVGRMWTQILPQAKICNFLITCYCAYSQVC